MTEEIDRGATRFGTVLAVAFAVLVTLFALPYSALGAALGAFGLALVLLALVGSFRRIVDLAGLVLAGAVVAFGLSVPSARADPVGTVLLLAAAVAAVTAWDVAGNTLGIGEQLGRSAETTRAEGAHALGTVGIGAFVSGTALAIFQGASGGQPVTALVFLLVAMFVLVSALRL